VFSSYAQPFCSCGSPVTAHHTLVCLHLCATVPWCACTCACTFFHRTLVCLHLCATVPWCACTCVPPYLGVLAPVCHCTLVYLNVLGASVPWYACTCCHRGVCHRTLVCLHLCATVPWCACTCCHRGVCHHTLVCLHPCATVPWCAYCATVP